MAHEKLPGATEAHLQSGPLPPSPHESNEYTAAHAQAQAIDPDSGVKRGLKNRHLSMMALAGIIGPGLLVWKTEDYDLLVYEKLRKLPGRKWRGIGKWWASLVDHRIWCNWHYRLQHHAVAW